MLALASDNMSGLNLNFMIVGFRLFCRPLDGTGFLSYPSYS
jgi:hypothetical protein